MKITTQPKSSGTAAFTLIELLTVIAIIAILAAMVMPVLSMASKAAKKTKARTEIAQIVAAIDQYESQYSRMPVSADVQSSGLTNITYGGAYVNKAGDKWPLSTTATPPIFSPGSTVGNYIPSNTDVMAILMDITNSSATSTWTINTNHQKNPQQTVFLKAAPAGSPNGPGLGTDLNFRDPWGNPYIITMDLSEDNKAEDAFYGKPEISSSTGVSGGTGLVGLICQPKPGGNGNYIHHGNVMVWSMGPEGPFSSSPSSFDIPVAPTVGGANDGANKQHILSWQQ